MSVSIPTRARTHNGHRRNFSSSQYILPSDDPERARLQRQHELIKRICDGQLIFAPVKFNSGDKILECGTGSGAWVMDVAPAVSPSVSVHGFDIARTLFPQFSPSNLSFSESSVLTMPKEWDNSFTLVHQRLLMAGLKEIEWPHVIREMYRVTAPGGWVQLAEIGDWKAGPATERHREHLSKVFEAGELLLDCANELEGWVVDAGFKNVRVETKEIRLGPWGGQDGIDAMVNWIDVFHSIKTPDIEKGQFEHVKCESDLIRMINDVEREWYLTSGGYMEFVVVYGQKPENAQKKN